MVFVCSPSACYIIHSCHNVLLIPLGRVADLVDIKTVLAEVCFQVAAVVANWTLEWLVTAMNN